MAKKKTENVKKYDTAEFIRKARAVHGDKYDYSKVEYAGTRIKVCVICPIHGEFLVRPDIHLQGCICKKCQFEKQKRCIFGKGYNDLLDASHTQAYKIWKHVLSRGYDLGFKKRHPTYANCTVCDDWLLFSNFKKWFDEHYVKEWHIDKDILVKGNRTYSPDTCCFVPHKINSLFVKSDKKRGVCCIGVTKHGTGFRALMMADGKHERLGTYRTEKEAFNAYRMRKEQFIKEVADKYKEELEPRVYEALYNYKVEITD